MKGESMFDHEKDVTLCQRDGKNYLKQGKQFYTFAEFNIGTKKWEPEPQPIDELDVISGGVEESLDKIVKMLQKILHSTMDLDQISAKARKIREDKDHLINQQRGKINHLSFKIEELEKKIRELEDSLAPKRGRPRKEVKKDEQ
jgi:hypothetical protein